MDEVEDLLRHSITGKHRQPLATVLTEASTLAGWHALDAGSINQAWQHYERGKTAAMEAGSTALLAHATAEQAVILLDIGETAKAVLLIEEARAIAGDDAPSLLRAWLSAAHGEALAASGQRDNALHAFDTASSLLPTESTHEQLPFLFLGGLHLDRWRGNALVKLGDQQAIDQLTRALDFARQHPSFVRAGGAMLVDLALAHATAGDRDAAQSYAQQARKIIKQVGSVRLRRRLQGLVLPSVG